MKLAPRRVVAEQLLDGAKMKRVESFELVGAGLRMTVELADGHLATLEFQPGQPITCRVIV